MTSLGHLIGYAIGSIDIVGIFGTTFGNTQFKQMTVIAAFILIFSVLVTSYAVKERVLVSARSATYLSLLFRRITELDVAGVVRQVRSRSCHNYLGRLLISRPGSRLSAGLNSGHGSVWLALIGRGQLTDILRMVSLPLLRHDLGR